MASRSPSIYDGMVVRVLLFPLKVGFTLVLVLTGLLLVAWTVDWVCVNYVWPGRVEGLRQLLAAEMAAGMELAARQGGSAGSVPESANWLYGLVFEVTGLHEMGLRFAGSGGISIPDSLVRDTWGARHEAVEVAMLGAQLLGLRGGILMESFPLLALLYAAGAAEGLRRRAIRRARRAPESANLYHRAKLGQLVVFALGATAVLVCPRPVAWSFCYAAGGAFVSLLVAGQLAYFKKYV